ncbi:hypothetical protein BKA93DRAFT_567042 [Sparassis latifolia]
MPTDTYSDSNLLSVSDMHTESDAHPECKSDGRYKPVVAHAPSSTIHPVAFLPTYLLDSGSDSARGRQSISSPYISSPGPLLVQHAASSSGPGSVSNSGSSSNRSVLSRYDFPSLSASKPYHPQSSTKGPSQDITLPNDILRYARPESMTHETNLVASASDIPLPPSSFGTMPLVYPHSAFDRISPPADDSHPRTGYDSEHIAPHARSYSNMHPPPVRPSNTFHGTTPANRGTNRKGAQKSRAAIRDSASSFARPEGDFHRSNLNTHDSGVRQDKATTAPCLTCFPPLKCEEVPPNWSIQCPYCSNIIEGTYLPEHVLIHKKFFAPAFCGGLPRSDAIKVGVNLKTAKKFEYKGEVYYGGCLQNFCHTPALVRHLTGQEGCVGNPNAPYNLAMQS